MLGRISMGIRTPIIREGDNLSQIIIDSILKNTELNNGDVIGITESIVARAQGNYVTVDELADEIKRVMHNPKIITIYNCIYSRNRFAIILRAIARAAGERVRIYMPNVDEVGNVRENHPFTGINYSDYYESIVKSEGKQCIIFSWGYSPSNLDENTIYCGLHDYEIIRRGLPNLYNLTDFFKDKTPYGLLGSNKATEEKIKLFPNTQKAQQLCEEIKKRILEIINKDVVVCVYGDGCFKDPVGGIWEFADPVTMPAYTNKELIESSPNEIKLKAVIDEGKTEEEIEELINNKGDLKGNMNAQGTTPRKYRDLLASLMDLTSGSGDMGTPVILVKNYFTNYGK